MNKGWFSTTQRTPFAALHSAVNGANGQLNVALSCHNMFKLRAYKRSKIFAELTRSGHVLELFSVGASNVQTTINYLALPFSLQYRSPAR